MKTSDIRKLLKPYEGLALECDGMTRVVSYLLKENDIPHLTKSGFVEYQGERVEPHFWIVLEDTGEIIDFRLRMWLGNHDEVSHGIFKEIKYPKMQYCGEEIELTATKTYFEILTGV